MPDDVKSKFAVASGVSQLVRWGPPQGDAAKDERSGMVGKLLIAVSALLAHEADCIELLESTARET